MRTPPWLRKANFYIQFLIEDFLARLFLAAGRDVGELQNETQILGNIAVFYRTPTRGNKVKGGVTRGFNFRFNL